MGRRRKRQQNEDFDDSLERAFAKRSKPDSDPAPETSGDSQKKAEPATKKDDQDEIERLREKKRLKKQRQKEKKLAAQKEQEKQEALREKQRKLQEKRKQDRKKAIDAFKEDREDTQLKEHRRRVANENRLKSEMERIDKYHQSLLENDTNNNANGDT